MRYRLRTLLILLAVGPPFVAGARYWHLNRLEAQRLAEERAKKFKLLDEAEPGVYFLGSTRDESAQIAELSRKMDEEAERIRAHFRARGIPKTGDTSQTSN